MYFHYIIYGIYEKINKNCIVLAGHKAFVKNLGYLHYKERL